MEKDSSDGLPGTSSTYNIPPEGSLGLLALGYRGIVAWRAVRDGKKTEEQADISKNSPQNNTDVNPG